MRKRLARLAVVGVALVAAGVAAGATYRGIEPVVVSGNPGCANISGLSYTTQVKFSPPLHGASGGGIYLLQDGNSIGWYTLGDVLVKAVIVKGGPNANLYRYPAFQDYSDGSLTAPLNAKTRRPYDLGAVTFCY